MNFTSVETIADAVLFEGCTSYPGFLKNSQQSNCGILYPRRFAEAQYPSERWKFHAEVLVAANSHTRISVVVRFLQFIAPNGAEPESWEDGFARSRRFGDFRMDNLLQGVERIIDFSALSADESRYAPRSFHEGLRRARLRLRATAVRDDVFRLTAEFSNESPVRPEEQSFRRAVLDAAFTSAHLLLGAESGRFFSLLEPPASLEADARACVQDGTFPVLAGAAGAGARILCSPIVLYDYPQVASESAGDFFDRPQMDKTLALRALAMAESERDGMSRCEPGTLESLEQMDSMEDEQSVQDGIKGQRTVGDYLPDFSPRDQRGLIERRFGALIVEAVRIFGITVRRGDRVRLWPQKRADAIELELQGKMAIVESIEQDQDKNLQLAVLLEGCPAGELGQAHKAGQRYLFAPEEVEPMGLVTS